MGGGKLKFLPEGVKEPVELADTFPTKGEAVDVGAGYTQ
jgi:hypothetical protein